MRPINSLIEFKQIIGRGTRLFDGKEYFTIIDFVDAYKHFLDKEWDGEPLENNTTLDIDHPKYPAIPTQRITINEPVVTEKYVLKIRLANGKEEQIQHTVATSFWSADGKPVSIHQFLENMYKVLPGFYKTEEDLRDLWSSPISRKNFLDKLSELGYDRNELETVQKLVDSEKSDLIDMFCYLSFGITPISREDRVKITRDQIINGLNDKQKEFIEYVLKKYIDNGVDELQEEKLPILLNLKYESIADAEISLGGVDKIRNIFLNFQKELYTSPITSLNKARS
jgi:type I restriction enzyme R subunit